MVVFYVAILASPLVIGGAISASDRARGFIARHYPSCVVVGWTAFMLVIPATIVLDGRLRIAALALLCPLMALTFWRRADGSDGDDDPGDTDPRPHPPEIDWDRFMRDLDEYAASSRS